jgi:hypothetical protein
MNWFKRITRRTTPAEAAARELAEAEMSVLEARTAVEYSESIVVYNETRIKRLKKFLAGLEKME